LHENNDYRFGITHLLERGIGTACDAENGRRNRADIVNQRLHQDRHPTGTGFVVSL
jgi:hypothetical protein